MSFRYGDTVLVHADYDGTPFKEPHHVGLLKPADDPTLQNCVNRMIDAAVLGERERCLRVITEALRGLANERPNPFKELNT